MKIKIVYLNSENYNESNLVCVFFSLSLYLFMCGDSIQQGLRPNVTDACEKNDPCQHGGICISTDSGPLCECRNLDYEGSYCEKGK